MVLNVNFIVQCHCHRHLTSNQKNDNHSLIISYGTHRVSSIENEMVFVRPKRMSRDYSYITIETVFEYEEEQTVTEGQSLIWMTRTI